MADRLPWTCPTCKIAVTTPFCARCGEEPLPPRDLTLRGVAEKVLHAVTSVDARTARSAWKLLRHPGELTLAWTGGVRKPYVTPFQLFLIANVFFFALQWLTSENVFSSPLDSHLHHQDWSDLAQSLLAQRLEKTQTSIDQYGPVFDRAVVLNAKSLILLMTVPFALLLPLVFFRQHRPFMTVWRSHSTCIHFCCCCFASHCWQGSSVHFSGFGGLDAPLVDNVLSAANLVVCAVYIYLAIGPVYRATGAMRATKAVFLAVAVAAIVLGYRFLLFLITLYAT